MTCKLLGVVYKLIDRFSGELYDDPFERMVVQKEAELLAFEACETGKIGSKRPESIAAASIYIGGVIADFIDQRNFISRYSKTRPEISEVAGVSMTTITKTHRDIGVKDYLDSIVDRMEPSLFRGFPVEMPIRSPKTNV